MEIRDHHPPFQGMTLLWLTAMVPQLKPPPCNDFSHSCNSPTSAQVAMLFSSFGLISVGAGCIRPCSMAFGADQLDNKENPDNERVLQRFLNWYYASTGLSTVLALTAIVYIQDHFGWQVGFGVPVVIMAFSALVLLFTSKLKQARACSPVLFKFLLQQRKTETLVSLLVILMIVIIKAMNQSSSYQLRT